ncbi:hypothetical protein C7N43_23870 [Sphingobacteriales bacterium UPWRP_1]|nr:hypothetical protein BVG80_05945 [Sphingobacteriales bacterium TSM_CSM]PSJ74481.1 hypothetical protein C7N43_23870 [Sphingobacteriales bacterium UPWRP_1]
MQQVFGTIPAVKVAPEVPERRVIALFVEGLYHITRLIIPMLTVRRLLRQSQLRHPQLLKLPNPLKMQPEYGIIPVQKDVREEPVLPALAALVAGHWLITKPIISKRVKCFNLRGCQPTKYCLP